MPEVAWECPNRWDEGETHRVFRHVAVINLCFRVIVGRYVTAGEGARNFWCEVVSLGQAAPLAALGKRALYPERKDLVPHEIAQRWIRPGIVYPVLSPLEVLRVARLGASVVIVETLIAEMFSRRQVVPA